MGCNVIGFARDDGMDGSGGSSSTTTHADGNQRQEYGYLNDDSNLERVIKPASNGNTVVSTIDTNVQKIVEKYITEWEQEVGSKRVGVIVMDPNNGEVLAMANDKSFDFKQSQTAPSGVYGRCGEAVGIQEAIDDYRRKK